MMEQNFQYAKPTTEHLEVEEEDQENSTLNANDFIKKMSPEMRQNMEKRVSKKLGKINLNDVDVPVGIA